MYVYMRDPFSQYSRGTYGDVTQFDVETIFNQAKINNTVTMFAVAD